MGGNGSGSIAGVGASIAALGSKAIRGASSRDSSSSSSRGLGSSSSQQVERALPQFTAPQGGSRT